MVCWLHHALFLLQCNSDMDYRQGGYTVRWQGLTFINTPRRILWTAPYKEMFWDLDGSLTGYANGWASPYYRWNEWVSACTHRDITYDNGIVCDNTVAMRRLQVNFVNPRELDFQSMIIDSVAGTDVMPFRPKEIYGWVAPVVTNKDYQLRFQSLVDWQTMTIRYSEPEYVSTGEYLMLSTTFTDFRLFYQVLYNSNQNREWLTDRLPTPTDQMGTGAMGYIANPTNVAIANNSWHVAINTVNATATDRQYKYQVQVKALQCPLSGCYVPPPPVS